MAQDFHAYTGSRDYDIFLHILATMPLLLIYYALVTSIPKGHLCHTLPKIRLQECEILTLLAYVHINYALAYSGKQFTSPLEGNLLNILHAEVCALIQSWSDSSNTISQFFIRQTLKTSVYSVHICMPTIWGVRHERQNLQIANKTMNITCRLNYVYICTRNQYDIQ